MYAVRGSEEPVDAPLAIALARSMEEARLPAPREPAAGRVAEVAAGVIAANGDVPADLGAGPQADPDLFFDRAPGEEGDPPREPRLAEAHAQMHPNVAFGNERGGVRVAIDPAGIQINPGRIQEEMQRQLVIYHLAPRFLVTSPLSWVWTDHARRMLGSHFRDSLLPMSYIFGMVGFALSLPFRVCEVGVKTILLIGHLFFFVVTGGRWVSRREVWIREKVFTASIIQLLSSGIGCVCPPLAYRIDEWVQSDDEIHARSMSPWFDEDLFVQAEMPAIQADMPAPDLREEHRVLKDAIKFAREKLTEVYPDHVAGMPSDLSNQTLVAIALLLRRGQTDEILLAGFKRAEASRGSGKSYPTVDELQQFCSACSEEALLSYLALELTKEERKNQANHLPQLPEGKTQEEMEHFINTLKVMVTTWSSEYRETYTLLNNPNV